MDGALLVGEFMKNESGLYYHDNVLMWLETWRTGRGVGDSRCSLQNGLF